MNSLRSLRDTIKRYNILVIGAPVRERKETGAEKIFEELITENVPNFLKNMYL